MSIPAPCPRCDNIHSPRTVTRVAGSRWAHRPYAYRATYPASPSRGTPEQAEQDWCNEHARGGES